MSRFRALIFAFALLPGVGPAGEAAFSRWLLFLRRVDGADRMFWLGLTEGDLR